MFDPMVTLLDQCEKINKDNHSKNFHEKHNLFYPFILSVDGMIGREALGILENLSRLMAEKTDEPTSHVKGWINSLIKIAVARSYSQMIRRAQLSIPLRD